MNNCCARCRSRALLTLDPGVRQGDDGVDNFLINLRGKCRAAF
jgi:hypothetical protein